MPDDTRNSMLLMLCSPKQNHLLAALDTTDFAWLAPHLKRVHLPLRAVVHDVEHRFHITHTTVQVEVEGCEANDMYCMGQHTRDASR